MYFRPCLLAAAVGLPACQAQPTAAEPPKPTVAEPPKPTAAPPTPTPPAQASAAAEPPAPPSISPTAAPASPPVPQLPAGGDRAFVADDTGLVEVALTGGSQVVTPGAVSWCSVDARGQVVWFVDASGLHSFDLVDRRIRHILAADLAGLEIVIDWGAEKLGGEDPVAFDVGVALHMKASASLSTVIGCDGDRAAYCFEDDGETPTDELAKAKARAAALRLAEKPYVASIAARGAAGSLWSPSPPTPATPSQKPTVPRKRCEAEPTACGSLIALPSSPLWLVVTGNSRGDYYDEARELWDPRTAEFVRLKGGALARAKKPSSPDDAHDYAGLRVWNGTFTHAGAVFDDSKVVFKPQTSAGASTSCGFTGGGWRIAGPTG